VLLRTARPGMPGEHNSVARLRIGEGASDASSVVILLHGQDCTLFDIAAPKGIRPNEWGTLIEDLTLDDPPDLHIVCIGRDAGRLQLLVVSRALIEAWHAFCDDAGLKVSACWVDFQTLSAPSEDSAVCRLDGDTALIKARVEGVERWLCWPRDQLERLPPVLAVKSIEWEPEELSLAATGPDPVNLWPGRQTRRPRAALSAGTFPRGLLLAMLITGVLAASLGSVGYWQAQRQEALLEQAVGDRLGIAGTALDVQRVRRTIDFALAFEARRHAEERLQQLFAQVLSGWLAENRGWSIRGWSQEGSRLTFSLISTSGDTAEGLQETIATGLNAPIAQVSLSDVDDGIELTFDPNAGAP
jgi:general secretion pathway protein L